MKLTSEEEEFIDGLLRLAGLVRGIISQQTNIFYGKNINSYKINFDPNLKGLSLEGIFKYLNNNEIMILTESQIEKLFKLFLNISLTSIEILDYNNLISNLETEKIIT